MDIVLFSILLYDIKSENLFHKMETLSALLDLWRGIQQKPVDFSHKGSVVQSFDVRFDISLIKLLKKQLS